MSTDDVVIINDDNQKDSDIEVVDISKDNSPKRTSTEDNNAIVIDDDIIEVIDIDAERSNKDVRDHVNEICTANVYIGEFIEKCLNLENTNGMLRVIYRTFLPLYFKMEDGYSESSEFKKVLDMAMRALELHPNLKFTHVKFVCDVMKSRSRDRKKVQITTLNTNVTAKPTKCHKQRKRRKRHNKYSSAKKSKIRTQHVIELQESSDGEDKHEEPAVHTPETDDVVILEDCNEVSHTSNKENGIIGGNSTASVRNSNINLDRGNNCNNARTPILEASQPRKQPKPCLSDVNNENEKKLRIEQIEKQIAYYKKMIDTLEQEEVKCDSMNSAYIKCERGKEQIVSLYKELCSLTGDDPIKKREVHFTATDGRPQLPLRILEKFINENIGPDGNPCLPDFFDVQECVSRANECAGLGWDKSRVWQEARALFTFCGQALQESRKKREWRYLVSVADEQLDDDPAERDPELMARLEANRRIAVKKECDLLEQYVKMEEGRYDGEAITNDFDISQDCSDDEIEGNTYAESTVTGANNVNRIENVSLNNENSIRQFCATSATLSVDVNNQKENVKQSQNCSKNNADTRMLEISVNSYQVPEVRVVTVNHTSGIGQSTVDYSQSSKSTRMIEVCVENNKSPEVKVINVTSSDCYTKGNLEQDIIPGTSTRVIDFDNSISEKFVETFEDTYKDFINNRAPQNFTNDRRKFGVTSKSKKNSSHPLMTKGVYSVESNENDQCKSTDKHSSENMPLVIKEVYSVATEQIDETQHNPGNNDNTVDVGNKCLLSNAIAVSSNQNYNCTQGKSSVNENDNRSNDTSVVPENMSIMIKNVYSVASKINSTNIQATSPELSNNFVTEKESLLCTHISSGDDKKINDTPAPNTNSELPKPDVEEGNLIVKTEVSDLLKEMETFGDTFTTTVFDIEDPFLVIEISDSSDESDDDLET